MGGPDHYGYLGVINIFLLDTKIMILTCFLRSEPEIILYNRKKPRRDTMGTCADVFRGFCGSKINFTFIFPSKTSKMVKIRQK